MKKATLLIVFVSICISACQTQNIKIMIDQKKQNSFNQILKFNNIELIPDSSINIQLFVEQYNLNPKSWIIAFKFLKENDLVNMPVGRYNLLADGTYASVTNYITKDPDTALFEAHKKYIDIQYVPVGREYIGLTSLDNIQEIVQEYDAEKDIEFFIKFDATQRLANNEKFFVFFPEDGHKPCLKVDTNSQVKKVVVKIPYIN